MYLTLGESVFNMAHATSITWRWADASHTKAIGARIDFVGGSIANVGNGPQLEALRKWCQEEGVGGKVTVPYNHPY